MEVRHWGRKTTLEGDNDDFILKVQSDVRRVVTATAWSRFDLGRHLSISFQSRIYFTFLPFLLRGILYENSASPDVFRALDEC